MNNKIINNSKKFSNSPTAGSLPENEHSVRTLQKSIEFASIWINVVQRERHSPCKDKPWTLHLVEFFEGAKTMLVRAILRDKGLRFPKSFCQSPPPNTFRESNL